MEFSQLDIKCLAEMLKPEDESTDDDDDLPRPGVARMGPGNIGTKHVIKSGKDDKNKPKESESENSIWDEADVPQGIRYDESEDKRIRPEYETVYKQIVTPEDMFLQKNLKTAATSSCEEMLVTIHLPSENNAAIDLNVKEQVLDLRSPKYRLSIPLQHPVKTESTKAVWVADKECLQVHLRLNREYDFINF